MKTRLFILFLAVPALFVSCGKESAPAALKRVSTVVAVTGSVVPSDAASSVVTGENTAELSFKAPGRIAEILVKAGDRVEKGQLLARLSNAEGAIQSQGYSAVVAGLSEMESSVERLYESRGRMTETDVANAQLRVELAKKDLELAKKNLENSEAVLSGSVVSASERATQAQKALSLAETRLQNTERLLAERETSLEQGALSAMANAFVVARTGRDFADEILGVTESNRHKNDAYDTYLGAKDAASVGRAETAFRAFEAKYSETYGWYYANVAEKTSVPTATVKEGLLRATETLRLEREALHGVKEVLEKTVASSPVLPESELNAMKAKADAVLSGLEASILSPNSGGTEGSTKALEAFDRERELTVASLQDAVKIAESDLALAKTGGNLAESDRRKNLDALALAVEMKAREVELAEKEVSKIRDSVAVVAREGDSKVAEIRTKVSEASMAARLAGEAAASSELRAPYSGIVLERRFDPGMVVNAGTPVLSVSDDSGMKTSVPFDSSLRSLGVGDEVVLRSQKSGLAFSGYVMSVAATDSLVTSKRLAEIRIPPSAAAIGDRVTALLGGTDSAQVGVTVPKESLVTRYSAPAVFVLENGVARLKTVRIVASDAVSAVVEGVPSGASVIVR